MNNFRLKFICSFILVFPFIAVAKSNQCLSGHPDSRHLITQLAQAKNKSPITSALMQKYNLDNNPVVPPYRACSSCQQGPGSDPLSALNKKTADIMRNLAPDSSLMLNTACLNAAGKIEASTAEIKCPEAKISNQHNFCFDTNLMRYQNAVITDFYKCVKKLTDLPLTPAGLFEMYSLESGFKPHYAYSGGVGLGQLTGIFVDDINQKHRGFKILNKIAQAEDSDCAIAKKIAAKDVKNPIRLNSNRCDFVEYGEGLERNILYSLVGMANSWNKDLEPLLENYITENKSNPNLSRAMELALLNSYGPGGRASARAAVKRLTKLTPTNFANQISKPMMGTKGSDLTTYVQKMQKKQKQLLTDMPSDLKTKFAKEGARACIQ